MDESMTHCSVCLESEQFGTNLRTCEHREGSVSFFSLCLRSIALVANL